MNSITPHELEENVTAKECYPNDSLKGCSILNTRAIVSFKVKFSFIVLTLSSHTDRSIFSNNHQPYYTVIIVHIRFSPG